MRLYYSTNNNNNSRAANTTSIRLVFNITFISSMTIIFPSSLFAFYVGKQSIPLRRRNINNKSNNWVNIKRLSISAAASSSSSSSTTNIISGQQRIFQFIPFGQSVSESILLAPNNHDDDDESSSSIPRVISCDGKIIGCNYELSHWDDNTTPEQYYADTSTVIALKYVTNLHNENEPNRIIIVNNHYDTDGVLSTFTCLYPDVAIKYTQLLTDAAAAGDFGEWISDNGVKLDLALTELLSRQERIRDDSDSITSTAEYLEASAYEVAYNILPFLLKDLQTNNGLSFQELWEMQFNKIVNAYNEFPINGSLEQGPGGIIIIKEPYYLPPCTIYRLLKESNFDTSTTTRLLRVVQSSDDNDPSTSPSSYCYYYEKPGHGWVTKLRTRTVIPAVQNETKLLNELQSYGWTKGGLGNLVAIAQSNSDPRTILEVANHFATIDPANL